MAFMPILLLSGKWKFVTVVKVGPLPAFMLFELNISKRIQIANAHNKIIPHPKRCN